MSMKLSVDVLLKGAEAKLLEAKAKEANLKKQLADLEAEGVRDAQLRAWWNWTIKEKFGGFSRAVALVGMDLNDAKYDEMTEEDRQKLAQKLAKVVNLMASAECFPPPDPKHDVKHQLTRIESEIYPIERDIKLLRAVHGPWITITYANETMKFYIP